MLFKVTVFFCKEDSIHFLIDYLFFRDLWFYGVDRGDFYY